MLDNKIDKIIDFIHSEEKRVSNARDKLNIYEGELLPYVEHALMNELSPSAFERARKRIAPINFMPKVVNKLSTLYNSTIIREIEDENELDVQLVDHYVKEFNMDHSGLISNQQLNLNKYTAWEIYINKDDQPRLRTLPAHQFLVYSDNMEDPTQPTVFIKLLGQYNKQTDMLDDDDKPLIKQVSIYKIYDEDQILVVDSDGEIRFEFMEQNPEGINPYGVIPFVYVRNSDHSLLPKEDTSDVPMITLIPLLLTDLNYATQFMSHSIIYTIDAELNNPSGNPDSIWLIKSDVSADGESDSKAQIGTIKPEVDIDKVITLIQTQLALWLDSKGLKAGSMGKLDGGNLASGISKMIDEADTTQAIKSQVEMYRKAEKELFSKLSIIHNIWVDQGLLSGTEWNRKFTEEVKVNTIFEEPQVIVNEKERIETISLKEQSGYTSHRKAIAEANPELSDDEVDNLLEEIKAEREEAAELRLTLVGEIDGEDEESSQEEEGEEEDREETPGTEELPSQE